VESTQSTVSLSLSLYRDIIHPTRLSSTSSRKPIPLPTPINITRLILALLPRPRLRIRRLMPRRRGVHVRLHTRIAALIRAATEARRARNAAARAGL
jgi:hypothetical protein